MGKIIETKYHDTVEKITGFNSTLIKNSFYTLNDKKPTIVTYYNIDRAHSTLDPGSKLAYDNIGDESPIRYNRIKDFIIYGFTRIELDVQNEEFGTEAEKISGECVVMPNTIVPTEGDYFEVEHITDSTWLFMVTDVQRDTLENGSNVYKAAYKLEYVDHDRLMNNVIDNYSMIEKREGTTVAKVVRSDKLEYAKKMDKLAVMLKKYYNELFYNPLVQTFTYMDLTEWRIYDPYMIEFLIRNKILDNGEDSYINSYIYVTHQIQTPKTFSMDYDNTIYRFLEKKNKNVSTSQFYINITEISTYGTTFASRFETYYEAKYVVPPVGPKVPVIDEELLYRIQDNRLFDEDDDMRWFNIIIKYFNEEDYSDAELDCIENMNYNTSTLAFYTIPMLIFCLEYNTEQILQ